MPFPMIKDEKKLEHAHMRIYETIKDYLAHGKNVGMLTIGDPGIYSTYMYMHRRAAEDDYNAHIISGVPSFCAVAARLGMALGEKNQEIHIIPASYDVKEFRTSIAILSSRNCSPIKLYASSKHTICLLYTSDAADD